MDPKVTSFLHQHCHPKEAVPDLTKTLTSWCDCNSGSFHPEGLAKMADILVDAIKPFADTTELITTPAAAHPSPVTGEPIPFPEAQSLIARTRPDAPIQVLLNGHMDTVYSPDSPFQSCTLSPDGKKLNGPGVADMKGGLLVMIKALEMFEKHPASTQVGWEILITPDEEIGSPGGDALLRQAASRHHLGLVFESSPPGGSLVKSRMGGGNFLLRAEGHSVHVGKNFSDGRNAIQALSAFIIAFQQLNDEFPEARFNTGIIEGGTVTNAVPDHAHAHFNIRINSNSQTQPIQNRIEEIRKTIAQSHNVQLHWHGTFSRPHKKPDTLTENLYQAIRETGSILDQDLPWHDTGGGADGSNLLHYGLPNIDSLGVIGAHLHSPQEYVELLSIPSRIHLTTLFLIRLATAELDAASFSSIN